MKSVCLRLYFLFAISTIISCQSSVELDKTFANQYSSMGTPPVYFGSSVLVDSIQDAGRGSQPWTANFDQKWILDQTQSYCPNSYLLPGVPMHPATGLPYICASIPSGTLSIQPGFLSTTIFPSHSVPHKAHQPFIGSRVRKFVDGVQKNERYFADNVGHPSGYYGWLGGFWVSYSELPTDAITLTAGPHSIGLGMYRVDNGGITELVPVASYTSNVNVIFELSAPSGVSGVLNNGFPQISWSPVSNAVQYEVTRYISNPSETEVFSTTSTGFYDYNFEISAPEPGQTLSSGTARYTVKAVNASGQKSLSSFGVTFVYYITEPCEGCNMW